jgi:2-polyprenyl-6-methoxyphenol hydroxylase-like FAD-dependent oxidoreductase
MKKVLISGASIAGPALAYWLHRRGFACTVVEVAPALRPGGQAVDVRGVAKTVLDRMGVMPRVEAYQVHEKGFSYVNAAGRTKAELPAELFGGEGIVAEIEILRGDLSRVMYDATREAADYRFGDRITELVQDAAGVSVTFASGTAERYDLVIGADGVHSGVRRLAFGPEEQFVRPLGGYTAYFSFPDPGDLADWFVMHSAPGGRTMGLRPARSRYTGEAQAMLSFRADPIEYDRRDVEQQKRIVAKAFEGVGWRAAEIVAAMWKADDFYFDMFGQTHVERWSRGRVALVGDACYCPSPLTGLGTSLGLVAAYVLSGELAATPEDHAAAFARYQSEMADYVNVAQTLPPGGIGGYAPNTRVMIALRNLSMSLMNHPPMRGVMAKQAAKSDAITLKAYEV